MAINTRLNAIVCRECRIVVLPGAVHEHLKNQHNYYRRRFTPQAIDEFARNRGVINDWDSLFSSVMSLRTQEGELVEFEGLKTYDGCRCTFPGCDTARIDERSIKDHWRSQHRECRRPSKFPKTTMQRLHNGHRYFAVNPRKYLTAPRDDAFDAMMEVLEESEESLQPDEDSRTRDPWQAKVKWYQFLEEKDTEDAREFARAPERGEFTGLRKGVLRLMRRIDGRLDHLSLLLQTKLNTEDPTKG